VQRLGNGSKPLDLPLRIRCSTKPIGLNRPSSARRAAKSAGASVRRGAGPETSRTSVRRLGSDRDAGRQSRVPDGGVDFELPADLMQALPHAGEADAGRGDTIVASAA
jgi:hypothetical protein